MKGPIYDNEQSETRIRYLTIINETFQSLKTDSDIKNKSLFDLIDQCELTFENLEKIKNSALKLKSFVKGYLLFNYFINNFIMVHFSGFDEFIDSNEQDFILYLHLYTFYNYDIFIADKSSDIPLKVVRNLILEYLETNRLLQFDVHELYNWLDEYVAYLKDKNEYETEGNDLTSENYKSLQRSSPSLNLSKTLLNDTESRISLETGNDESLVDDGRSIGSFMHRFPSIHTADYTDEKKTKKYPDNQQIDLISSSDHGSNVEILSKSEIPKSLSTAKRPPIPFAPPLLSKNEISDNLYNSEEPRFSNPRFSSSQKVPYPVSKEEKRHILPYPINYPNAIGSNLTYDTNGVGPSGKILNPPLSTTEERFSTSGLNERNYYMSSNTHASGSESLISSNDRLNRSMTSGVLYPTIPSYSQNPMQQSYTNHSPVLVSTISHSNSTGKVYMNGDNKPPELSNHPSYATPSHPSTHNTIKRLDVMKAFSICGLKNFGSSCYINSTMQLLFGISYFKKIFIDGNYKSYIETPKFKSFARNPRKDSILLSDGVAGLLKSFILNGGASIAPTKFLQIASRLKPDFNIPNEQQDAQEYLLFVLDRLHEELMHEVGQVQPHEIEKYIKKWHISIGNKDKEEYSKWYESLVKSEGTSPIHDMFQGHLQSKLTCNSCNFESTTFSPFTILSLPIPVNLSSNVDLSDCLRYYIQDEVLTGDNAWKCPKCFKEEPEGSPVLDNHPVFAQKKGGLFRLGRRSKSPYKGKSSTKTSKEELSKVGNSISTKTLNFIKMPPVLFLHLARFSMFNLVDKLNTVIKYPIILKFNNHTSGHGISYRMVGIVNHYGNLKSGHYTALVDKSISGTSFDGSHHPYWCFFDDDSVKMNMNYVSPAESIEYEEHSSSDVYLLCYERI